MKPSFGSKRYLAKVKAHNSWASTLKRVNKARNFPTNTCPASRHTVMIARELKAGRLAGLKYLALDPDEREHIALSILFTVEALWNLRTKTLTHVSTNK